MTDTADVKALMHARLQLVRSTLWEKAEGLPEWQQRLPLTPTGTNLLGLIKHVAFVEAGYFGDCLGRPLVGLPEYADPLSEAAGDMEPDDDLWAFADESPGWVLETARSVAERVDVTISELSLDHVGHVPWWGRGGRDATLGELLMHMLNETSRHLGQADILREQLDGEAGLYRGNSNLPWDRTAEEWRERFEHLKAVAEATR